MSDEERKKGLPPGSGIGIGIALGVALGVAMDNIAVGIAIGVALGAGIDAASSRRGEVDTTNPDVRRRMMFLLIGLAVLGLLALGGLVAWLLMRNG